jgi:hypothetical protein
MGDVARVRHPELGIYPAALCPGEILVVGHPATQQGTQPLLGPLNDEQRSTWPKRAAFFAVRITMATISTLCEAKLYETVKDKINNRVGRYFLFFLLTNVGMWNASSGLSVLRDHLFANSSLIQRFYLRRLPCMRQLSPTHTDSYLLSKL